MKANEIFNAQLKIADALNATKDAKQDYMAGVVSTMFMCGKLRKSSYDVYMRVVKIHYAH